jgi:hypothetical protein
VSAQTAIVSSSNRRQKTTVERKKQRWNGKNNGGTEKTTVERKKQRRNGKTTAERKNNGGTEKQRRNGKTTAERTRRAVSYKDSEKIWTSGHLCATSFRQTHPIASASLASTSLITPPFSCDCAAPSTQPTKNLVRKTSYVSTLFYLSSHHKSDRIVFERK